ncbi:unnamed protein product [Caenorhabditis brenneri]
MPQWTSKFQLSVGLVIGYASWRFRQMAYARYLMEGRYFQHAEFLLNAFIGLCWVRPDFIALAIFLILISMVMHTWTIYLSLQGLESLMYYGTFRTKYFFEYAETWPLVQIAQAEATLDILLGVILIKALETIEKELLEIGMEEQENHYGESQEDQEENK